MKRGMFFLGMIYNHYKGVRYMKELLCKNNEGGDNMDIWKNPEVIKLYNEIEALQSTIDKRLKENRLEIYNTGEKIHKKQIIFHESSKRIKSVFGGNRTGKTVAGAVEAVCRALWAQR